MICIVGTFGIESYAGDRCVCGYVSDSGGVRDGAEVGVGLVGEGHAEVCKGVMLKLLL